MVSPAGPKQFDQLDAMGFPRALSERALAQANGDPERAIELILGGQVQEHSSTAALSMSSQSIEEAMSRLRSRPPNDHLALSIYTELPKKKKIDQGWILAKLQEAMTLYDIKTNDGAAQLFYDVMTDKITLEKLAQDASRLAFSFQDEIQDAPLQRRQSAKALCGACGDEKSGSTFYVSLCNRQDPPSAHGGASGGGASAAAAADPCRVCYPCLFDGLHSQFTRNELPHCVMCHAPLHQNAFNEIMAIQEANFRSDLGNNHLDNTQCTCGVLPPSMWQGSAAQNPESIKMHNVGCSFAIIKRMKNQVDDLLMRSAISGGEFFVFCPGAGCRSVVEVAVIRNPTTGKSIKVRECVRCSSCSTSFCSKCGATPYHFHTECEDIAPLRGEYSEWMARGRQAFLRQRAEMDASFEQQLQDYEADKARVDAEKKLLEVVAQQAAKDEEYKAQHCKMCPNCGRIVEHMGGCAAMVCGQDYHGGNNQMGCGHSFRWPDAPAYKAQDVQPRQIEFNKERPQQIIHRWQVYEGQDLNCDACAGPIIGPKFTCVNCQSLTICATCESLGPQALQSRLNKAFFGAHQTNHTFMVEMPPA
jgi:hypothetical protein